MNEQRVYLRTSERTSFKTCRQQWHWTYNEGLRPKQTAPALWFGDLVHQALALYYRPGRKRGPAPAKAFEGVYKEQVHQKGFVIRDAEDGEYESALDLGIDMLTNYVERWDDSHMEILVPECPIAVDVMDKKGKKYMVTYLCQFDAIFRDLNTNQIGLLEHKTAANIDTSHLGLDEQAGSYWAFAGDWLSSMKVLRPGRQIDFILYNFLRKAKADTRPQNEKGQYLNKDGSVSKKQPPPSFVRQRVYRSKRDRENLIQRVRMEAYEMAQIRAGKLPIYKNPRASFPDQHCKSCGFKDMCELHETGNDWKEFRDVMMEKHDPYEQYNDEDQILQI